MMSSKMPIGIVTIFIFFFQPSFAQVPDYFGNNPEWFETEFWEDEVTTYLDDVRYFAQGDTLIGSYTYKKIFLEYLENSWTPEYYGAYRQQGRSIYFFNGTNDTLFTSYEQNVGEVWAGEYGTAWNGVPVGTIDKIDSVLVGTEYRRLYHIDTLGMNQYLCIEGIGFVRKVNSCFGSMFRAPFSFTEGNIDFNYCVYNCKNWVESYSQNGIEVWNCSFFAAVDNNAPTLTLTIYPNPFSEYTTIELPSNLDTDAKLYFYNLLGEEILNISTKGQTQIQIDKSMLPQGVYFISILENNQTQNLGKIISL